MSNSSADFDLLVFLEQYRRPLIVGATVVAVGGAGFWFWRSSAELKQTRAEQALVTAERAMYSGNLPLAEAELQRVVNRYGGTLAAVRGQMMLAQTLYQQGRHEQAVSALSSLVSKRAAAPFRSAIHALIAAGHEDLGRLDQAAEAYDAAAKAAPTNIERDAHTADRARVLQGAGQTQAALEIWQALADDENSPMAAEARLRVGELTAKAASRT